MARSCNGKLPFSREDCLAICSYVLKKLDQGQQYFYPGSDFTWKRASAEGLLPGRSIHSLRNHFSRNCLPNLHTLLADPADAERLAKSIRYMLRLNRPVTRLAKSKSKSFRTATVRPAIVEKMKALENPEKPENFAENSKNFAKKPRNFVETPKNSIETREKLSGTKNSSGKIGRGFYYSKDEFSEMIKFVAKKLRDWPKTEVSEFSWFKLWTSAKAEGLFPKRTLSGLYGTFRLKVLPNLHKFVTRREDYDFIQSCLRKFPFGMPHGRKSRRSKVRNAGGCKKLIKNPSQFRRIANTKDHSNYTYEESKAICSYILRKLDSGQQHFYAGSSESWIQASAEGLLPHRKSECVRHYFYHSLKPNLQKFVEDPNDLERLKACFRYTNHHKKTSNIFDQIAAVQSSKTIPGRLLAQNHVISSGAHVETVSSDDDGEENKDCGNENDAYLSTTSVRGGKIYEKSHHFPKEISEKIRVETSESCHKNLHDENRRLKQALDVEKREKLANYRLIENLSRQLDYHERETVRRQNEAYQLKSRSIEMENDIVRLKIQLSQYANEPTLSQNMYYYRQTY